MQATPGANTRFAYDRLAAESSLFAWLKASAQFYGNTCYAEPPFLCAQAGQRVAAGGRDPVHGDGYADPIPPTQQTFADVPPSDPFCLFVERVAAHGILSGYTCNPLSFNPCSGQAEECDSLNRPYFCGRGRRAYRLRARLVADARAGGGGGALYAISDMATTTLCMGKPP